MEKPKIFCIGANLESHECLKYLVEKGCLIHTLITLPSGKGAQVSDYVDLHDFCRAHGINVIDTTNVNSEETLAAVRAHKPDYLFTLGWSQIFKNDLIRCFSQFVIGTHPSALPYGRGRAPLPWTILEDLRESAVSFFKIDTGVDTGKLITQKFFTIPERAYVGDVYKTVGHLLAEGFYEIYRDISQGNAIQFTPQKSEGITVRAKRSPEDGFIDFKAPADTIDRLVRAVSTPYPGAYTYYRDTKIIFWAVDLDKDGIYSGVPGQILKKGTEGLLVQCGDENLWLKEPTDADGNPIELKFFKLGDKLGYNIQDEIFKLKSGK